MAWSSSDPLFWLDLPGHRLSSQALDLLDARCHESHLWMNDGKLNFFSVF